MIVSINQPAYIPWLGYFDRIVKSDLHITLDHVQFEKNSMVNRNKIRTLQGASLLTVPLRTKGQFGQLAINRIETDNTQKWAAKHLKSLMASYNRAPYADEHMPFFTDVLSKEWQLLHPLLRCVTDYLLKSFRIRTEIISSATMECTLQKSDLVLEICRKTGATTYLSGALGRNYLDLSTFQKAGIEVIFQDYIHPVYSQCHGEFIPFMSAVDLLFNHGPDARDIMENK